MKNNKVMKKLLYTFFFGYASLKWRRLFRTLIILPALTLIVFGPVNIIVGGISFETFVEIFLIMSAYLFAVGLISWLIKPFIVKED